MKTLKNIAIAVLCVLAMASCSKNNDDAPGNPVLTPSTSVTSAQFGDSIPFKINVKDEGNIPLSTLKALLYYGDELVSTTVIRTKTEGDYAGKVYVPFLKNIPDGTATLKFVLQNIHFTKVEKDYDVALTRPKYASLTLHTSDGKTYSMTPSASNPYQFTTTVNATTNKVKAYISAPVAGNNGNVVNFGISGSDVVQGTTDNISFISGKTGEMEITFNTLTYAYTPLFMPVFNGTAMTFVKDGVYTYYGTFTKGQKYTASGADDMNASDWYYSPDFFTKNSDGSYTFNAVTGLYKLTADFNLRQFQVYAMTNETTTATLQSDGSGALWIIGGGGIGQPTYSSNGINWGTEKAICMAQVSPKVYQVTLIVGKQLNASDVNFKFFHQNTWGGEFDGKDGSAHLITTTSTVFLVGNGTIGSGDGNISLADGATLTEGDTYVLTVDCTKGTSNVVLTATKK